MTLPGGTVMRVIWSDEEFGEDAVGLDAVILSDQLGHVVSYTRDAFACLLAAYSAHITLFERDLRDLRETPL